MFTCERCGMVHTKANAIKIWRKHGWGRLYWRRSNHRWQHWQFNDAIAMAKQGTARTWFTDYEAIIHLALRID